VTTNRPAFNFSANVDGAAGDWDNAGCDAVDWDRHSETPAVICEVEGREVGCCDAVDWDRHSETPAVIREVEEREVRHLSSDKGEDAESVVGHVTARSSAGEAEDCLSTAYAPLR